MSRICIPTPASTVIGVGTTPLTTPNPNVFRVDTTITSLTGGSDPLQDLDTATDVYPVGICVFLPSLTVPATYQLVNGTDAENLPFVVRPSDYNSGSNAKVWKQRM
jgi:hypothetical protein